MTENRNRIKFPKGVSHVGVGDHSHAVGDDGYLDCEECVRAYQEQGYAVHHGGDEPSEVSALPDISKPTGKVAEHSGAPVNEGRHEQGLKERILAAAKKSDQPLEETTKGAKHG